MLRLFLPKPDALARKRERGEPINPCLNLASPNAITEQEYQTRHVDYHVAHLTYSAQFMKLAISVEAKYARMRTRWGPFGIPQLPVSLNQQLSRRARPRFTGFCPSQTVESWSATFYSSIRAGGGPLRTRRCQRSSSLARTQKLYHTRPPQIKRSLNWLDAP